MYYMFFSCDKMFFCFFEKDEYFLDVISFLINPEHEDFSGSSSLKQNRTNVLECNIELCYDKNKTSVRCTRCVRRVKSAK